MLRAAAALLVAAATAEDAQGPRSVVAAAQATPTATFIVRKSDGFGLGVVAPPELVENFMLEQALKPQIESAERKVADCIDKINKFQKQDHEYRTKTKRQDDKTYQSEWKKPIQKWGEKRSEAIIERANVLKNFSDVLDERENIEEEVRSNGAVGPVLDWEKTDSIVVPHGNYSSVDEVEVYHDESSGEHSRTMAEQTRDFFHGGWTGPEQDWMSSIGRNTKRMTSTIIIRSKVAFENMLILRPIVFDPDLVIDAWDELNKDDPFGATASSPEQLLQVADAPDNNENVMSLATGTRYVAHFLGMMDVLKNPGKEKTHTDAATNTEELIDKAVDDLRRGILGEVQSVNSTEGINAFNVWKQLADRITKAAFIDTHSATGVNSSAASNGCDVNDKRNARDVIDAFAAFKAKVLEAERKEFAEIENERKKNVKAAEAEKKAAKNHQKEMAANMTKALQETEEKQSKAKLLEVKKQVEDQLDKNAEELDRYDLEEGWETIKKDLKRVNDKLSRLQDKEKAENEKNAVTKKPKRGDWRAEEREKKRKEKEEKEKQEEKERKRKAKEEKENVEKAVIIEERQQKKEKKQKEPLKEPCGVQYELVFTNYTKKEIAANILMHSFPGRWAEHQKQKEEAKGQMGADGSAAGGSADQKGAEDPSASKAGGEL